MRVALKREVGAALPVPPPVRLVPCNTEIEERIEQFCLALGKLSAQTFVAASCSDAAEYVHQLVGDKPAIAADSALLKECRIVYPAIPTDKAEVGITGADYGLADTGTLVTLACSDPRLFSLLPPLHIALLKRDRLLSGLDELLLILSEPALHTSSMVLITGPSRTGDIEQILVRGVHGPGELHAVIVP